MKQTLLTVHFGLSVILLLALIVEFFFAGMGVFHAASFQIHQLTGVLLLALSLILFLLALISRAGGKIIGFSALLLLLLFIQPLLLQIHQPFVQALHVVNGLAILTTTAYLISLTAKTRKEQA